MAALGHAGRLLPPVKMPVVAAAVLAGGILLGGVLLHGKAAQIRPAQSTAGKSTAGKSMSVPETIISLHGRVVNADGSPAAGAAVHLMRSAAPDGAQSQFAEVQTDREGRYQMSGPASARDQWGVAADSGSRLGFGVPGTPCVLLPPTRLRLHLVGNAGQPLPNVTLQPLLLTRMDAAGQSQTVSLEFGCPKRLRVRSDRSGNAVFTGLPRGCQVSFAVLDPAYERRPPLADGLLLAAQADSGTQAVTVARGASVGGKLLYAESGLPAAGVRIGAQETSTAAWGEAQTDAEGRYVIRQLPPGRYTVAVDEDSGPLESGWTAGRQGILRLTAN